MTGTVDFGFLYSADTASPDELCAALGTALGLEQAVPLEVMRRAIVDKAFAFSLINCQRKPELLAVLFSDPRNREFSDGGGAVAEGLAIADAEPSGLALALRAGQAVARWGASGFGRVPPEVFESRFGACQRCEHLVEPPDRAVYKVKLRRESDPRVCSACGCVAARKASLPTESCPVADSADPALNRWGEPRRGGRPTSS
jgi:hypothetical protein